MSEVLSNWRPRQKPSRIRLEGQYVDIVPLNVEDHAQQLYEASHVADGAIRFRWLPETAPTDFNSFRSWVEKSASSDDPIFSVVVDKESGKVAVRQSLMRIDVGNGVVEIGNIYWGPSIAQKVVLQKPYF